MRTHWWRSETRSSGLPAPAPVSLYVSRIRTSGVCICWNTLLIEALLLSAQARPAICSISNIKGPFFAVRIASLIHSASHHSPHKLRVTALMIDQPGFLEHAQRDEYPGTLRAEHHRQKFMD